MKDKGRVLKDGRYMTPKFRINYPCVCTRRAADEEYDPGRFTVKAVFFPEESNLSILKNAAEECAKKAGFKKGWKSPFSENEEYGEGAEVANLKFYGKRGKPVVLWADKTPVESDEDIISGSYGKAIVSFFAYDKNGGKGVTLVLESIQCLGGGKMFVSSGADAAAKRAKEEFEEEDYSDTAENDEDDEDEVYEDDDGEEY